VKYTEAITYLYTQLPMFQRQGKVAFKKDLKNIKLLSTHLGHPEKKWKSIHIAGTNGKGTTAHLLASFLQAQGYKVGLYTSPHYKDFRERVKINGTLISKKYVKEFVTAYQALQKKEIIEASFFELTVAMAFDYFAKEKVDYAVIETGLGGRLDSTNIILPLLSIITNIGYDHMDMLGNTLGKIAKEKAGIIKLRTPVIVGEIHKETRSVFEKKAEAKKARIAFAQELGLEELLSNIKHPEINRNPFFEKNLLTAIAGYLELTKIETNLNADLNFTKILKHYKDKTYFIGRWQQLGSRPTIIADSAHNEDGLKLALNRIAAMKYNKLWIVFGMVRDKEPEKVYKLLPKDAFYHYAKANIPRGKSAEIILEETAAYGLKGKSYTSVSRAFSAAKKKADEKDLIVVIGSIFVVAEVI
jgi:dihydrofolate synthase/folylpolyglutamate synthase